jgi:hypothetical protein
MNDNIEDSSYDLDGYAEADLPLNFHAAVT